MLITVLLLLMVLVNESP